jgi:hypothetical protein
MHAMRLVDEEDGADARIQASGVVAGLIAARRQEVAENVMPLKAEAARVAAEIDALQDEARRRIWETLVQVREIHDRVSDATARLEHLQLDIREQTGEVRLPAVPMPFVDFLFAEIRRFAITIATPESESTPRCSAVSGW